MSIRLLGAYTFEGDWGCRPAGWRGPADAAGDRHPEELKQLEVKMGYGLAGYYELNLES